MVLKTDKFIFPQHTAKYLKIFSYLVSLLLKNCTSCAVFDTTTVYSFTAQMAM